MTRVALALTAMLLTLALSASIARGEFGLVPGSFQTSALDANGQPELRAGAHPDRLLTSFAFNALPDGSADGNVKDVIINLPSGFAGDPAAVPTCSRADFTQNVCRPESQVGIMHAVFVGLGALDFPIYNIAPREDEIAEFGFFALIFPIRLVVGLRDESDYSTQIELRDLPQNVPLTSSQVELWGVPADHQSGTTIPRRPFLTNPTSCDQAPPTTSVRVRSWQRPEEWISTTASGAPLTECDALPFAPSFGFGIEATTTDTPTGASVDLTLPQDEQPDGRATSHIRGVSLTLPGGLTLSPGFGHGLEACGDDAFGPPGAMPACPPASKFGSIELSTPALPEPISGDVFFGRPTPQERFRMLVAGSARGTVLKLAGALHVDEESGRLTVTLDGLPALPLDHLTLRFKGGPRAPLTTPMRCGAGAATASVAAYRGTSAQLASTIEITGRPAGGACGRVAPFAPQLVAGSSPPLAGRDSDFTLTATRADGDQPLGRLAVTLPPGLVARLGAVPRCSDADALAARCTPASRIGSVAGEVGAGAAPLALSGDAYLTGPHDDAPFGLALALHAQIGPIDLGTVVVRAALRLDPADARVTIETDHLPLLVAGIPLRLRTLALDVTRNGFMLNPTSCEVADVRAAFRSVDAASATAAVRYAVGGCRRLRFTPSAWLSIGPADELRRGGHPELRIRLRSKAGDATPRSATFRLPGQLALDAGAVNALCTRRLARAGACPASTSVGRARVRTPLLPRPLTGSVNVVQPVAGVAPELWATVRGAGVRLHLRSRTSAAAGKPVTATFVDLPDVPMSSLVVTLRGGGGGLLTLTRSVCGRHARRLGGSATLHAHNGAIETADVPVRSPRSC
jgi:hypothetical protein